MLIARQAKVESLTHSRMERVHIADKHAPKPGAYLIDLCQPFLTLGLVQLFPPPGSARGRGGLPLNIIKLALYPKDKNF
jgi:hypothetical protein